MLSLDTILSFMRTKGPVIPLDVARHIGKDTLMASAALSDLSSKGKVKISHLKVGSSPLYYLPGQEFRLESFKDKLNEKDRRTFNLLKKERVLRDKTCEPLVRVSLRGIKDFAKPIQVNIGGTDELFWKFHTISKDDATAAIKSMLNITEPVPEPQPAAPEPVRLQPQPASPGEKVSEQPTAAPPKPVKKEPEKASPKEPAKGQKKLSETAGQKKSPEPPKEFVDRTGDDPFLARVKRYFDDNEIVVVDFKVIRKNSDIECVIDVPSSVGMLSYFCKAKNKKKSNDGDLSSAYLVGQAKKLPVIYLTTGELTGKAFAMLATEFKGLAFKRLTG